MGRCRYPDCVDPDDRDRQSGVHHYEEKYGYQPWNHPLQTPDAEAEIEFVVDDSPPAEAPINASMRLFWRSLSLEREVAGLRTKLLVADADYADVAETIDKIDSSLNDLQGILDRRATPPPADFPPSSSPNAYRVGASLKALATIREMANRPAYDGVPEAFRAELFLVSDWALRDPEGYFNRAPFKSTRVEPPSTTTAEGSSSVGSSRSAEAAGVSEMVGGADGPRVDSPSPPLLPGTAADVPTAGSFRDRVAAEIGSAALAEVDAAVGEARDPRFPSELAAAAFLRGYDWGVESQPTRRPRLGEC